MTVKCGYCHFKDVTVEGMLLHAHDKHANVCLDYQVSPKNLESKSVSFNDDYGIKELSAE